MRQDPWILRALGALAFSLGAVLAPDVVRAAPEKVAVLVLGTAEKDTELADNVTEVVIAAVARKGAFEIAGKEEFRARLGVESERRGQACLDDVACVGRTAVSLGVRRIVAGSVGTRGNQYLFNLNLHNVESGNIENRVFRLIEGEVGDLIRAVEAGAEEVFRPKLEPGRVQVSSAPSGARVSVDNAYLGVTPLISGALIPGPHRVRVEANGRFPWMSTIEVVPGRDLGIDLTEANLPRRRQWPSVAAYTTGALGLTAVAAGGFLGVLSQLNPAGETRAAAKDDFEQKRRLATGANASFITGGVLALTSITLFLVFGDDIFGRGD